jgi:hypothetical protein
MLDPDGSRELALQEIDLGPHDELLAVAHARQGGQEVLAQRLMLRGKIHKRDRRH